MDKGVETNFSTKTYAFNSSILYEENGLNPGVTYSTLIEKDHPGDWSPDEDSDFCFWLAFRQSVQKPSSGQVIVLSQLENQKPWWAIGLVNR